MFKDMKKLAGMNEKDRAIMRLLIGIGVIISCIMVVVYTAVVCGIIYFIFWCLEHFELVSKVTS